MQKTVEIRSRKNPEVTRTITAKSWANWPKRDWELVDSIQVSETKIVKKKDVEVAVNDIKKSVPVDDFVPPLVDDLEEQKVSPSKEDDSGVFQTPFPDDIGDEQVTQAPNYELEDLRAQYEQKFGKPADKRMKVETLKAKINESI